MRIARFSFTPYELPLVKPWRTARGTFTSRYGCLIALRSLRGEVGLGEMAPLTIPDAKAQAELLRLLERLRQTRIWPRLHFTLQAFDEWCVENKIPAEEFPDLTFALQCAMGGLYTGRYRKPLHMLLSKTALGSVLVNAVIPAEEPSEILAAVEQAVANGFHTLKLKIGVRTIAEDLQLLTELRTKYPEIKLRVDANSRWTGREAQRFCRDAFPLNLEYVEDPLRVFSIASLTMLRMRGNVPVALDDSPVKPETIVPGRRWHNPCVLIVKPSRYGTFTALQQMARQAAEQSSSLVFTGSFESSVGLSYVAACAAAFGSATYAHGLATAAWLAEDTVSKPLLTQRGALKIPDVSELPKYLLFRYQDELGIAT
jgi:o-succinylbenzoate synthase